MKSTAKTKTWERTKTPGLLKHKGGTFYGRFSVGGKTKFVPLHCTLLEIARIRFAEEKTKVERVRRAARANTQGTANMGNLLEIYRGRIQAKQGIKDSTRRRYLDAALFIERTWPDLLKMRPEQVTRTEIENWRDRALKQGSGFRPPGAKSASDAVSGRSASSYNKSLDALRAMLDYAVDAGAIHANPIRGHEGLKETLSPKKPQLPDKEKLRAVYDEIERSGEIGGWSVETADLCRLLNFTGCRLAEAGALTWGDVSFSDGILRVAGTKTDAAHREVPLNDDAKTLLQKIKARREKSRLHQGLDATVPATERILLVREARKSLTRACKAVGVPRLGHHDLRDAFATGCIEAGVDIPTVAGWLGHSDGGALLMRVYNHHRRPHSVAQMQRVRF
jgi:integrase